MELSDHVRKLTVPEDFAAPTELSFDGLTATPLTRADLDEDVGAVNANLELIRRTRGGDWPPGPVDEDYDFTDLVWHEQEFRERSSFAYVIRDDSGAYVGCAYLYPLGTRTPLSEELLSHDVDVSWWVTGEAYERGDYRRLRDALVHWLAEAFPFEAPHLSNRELPPD